MATVHCEHLRRTFDGADAVNDLTLDIPSGQFFSIVGPSGCGKTTLLRIIAGFEPPDEGRVFLDGHDVTTVPPQNRHIGMVFQNYALFPHMTVYENVAFGLRMRKVPEETIRERVAAMIESVHLGARSHARVTALSGGEQQRVAVARALVTNPALLLFDEPLSNLDVALRLETREEIRAIQRATGITTIYVTHDQSEAMSLSHSIAVMRKGRIEQMGPPDAMYNRPASLFVAQFLGGASTVRGNVEGGCSWFRTEGMTFPLPPGQARHDGPAVLAIKPEGAVLTFDEKQGQNRASVVDREYLGFMTTATVAVGSDRIRVAAVSSPDTLQWVPGAIVSITLRWSGCFVFMED